MVNLTIKLTKVEVCTMTIGASMSSVPLHPFARFHLRPHVEIPSFFTVSVHVFCILYGFTKSDIMTVLVPTTAFGTVAAGSAGSGHLLRRFAWVWFHLLHFCVSNQCLDPEEDAKNKPWRPIPAGKISVAAARWLRWALLVWCLLISAQWDVLAPAVVLALATFAHNELLLGSNWFMRNALNAVGYGSFSIGATYVGRNIEPVPRLNVERDAAMGGAPLAVHLMNAAVILTTIQAQDFKDVEGDASVGRRTLPIAHPQASRILTAVLIPAWSLISASMWPSHSIPSGMMVALSMSVGLRFMFWRTRAADQRSYAMYNVWLCLMHVLPFVGR
ncbi:UbiA prenyltransferase family-domain-containing protein [Trametes elegans]|nr:UbiA prenyltransferase family-domain-containing protein [Trametes elegans]